MAASQTERLRPRGNRDRHPDTPRNGKVGLLSRITGFFVGSNGGEQLLSLRASQSGSRNGSLPVDSDDYEEIVPLVANPGHSLSPSPEDDDLSDNDRGDGDRREPSDTIPHGGDELRALPWRKRPSPWWLICANPIIGIPLAATIAAKVQLYTQLVCFSIKPEISTQSASALAADGLSSSWKLPEPTDLCLSDPDVQKSLASLMATIATVVGVMATLTTVPWGQFSDRHGRTPLLAISSFTFFLADASLILIVYFFNYLPGGYRFIFLIAFVEGVLGGATTAESAYVADSSDPDARSRFFSLNIGIFSIGIAIGPTLGGYIVSSSNDLLSVFYLSAVSNFLAGLYYWFVVPESLPLAARDAARKKAMEKGTKGKVDLRKAWGSVLASLWALKMFLPKRVVGVAAKDDGDDVDAESWGRDVARTGGRKDWNMFWYAICMLVMALSAGSYRFVSEYTGAQFAWRSEQIGHMLSASSITRTIVLLVLLPLITKRFGPKSSSSSPDKTASSRQTTQIILFDLLIARISILIEIIGLIGMTLSRKPTSFLLSF